MTEIEEEKKCLGECGLVKPLSQFSVARGNKDGKSNRCKKCDYLKNRKRIDRIKEYNNQFGII